MRTSKLKLALAMSNKEYNFSQLAQACGVSRTTLSYINNGKECKPSIIIKIAKALEVNPEDIIEKKE